jgi:hypothetical protein
MHEKIYGSYVEGNNAERARLKMLGESLTDEQLQREMRDGWTVASMFAHLAMLDRLRLEGWELQTRSPEHQRWFVPGIEINQINEATKSLLLAIPPREAVRLAVEAAEAIDSKVASLSPDLVQSYESANEDHETRMLNRWIHRRMHLDEIEKAVG